MSEREREREREREGGRGRVVNQLFVLTIKPICICDKCDLSQRFATRRPLTDVSVVNNLFICVIEVRAFCCLYV